MTLPQPGYYADPDDSSIERWWDGGKWIGQTRPSQGNPPLPMENPPKVGTSLPPATPAAQGTRPCPDCGGMASVNAQTCVHCGAPLDAVAPEQPQAFSAAEKTGRSGYYAAAWVSLLFCLPLTIVFNLMDNSVSKSKGLPPSFAPTLVAIVLWVAFAAIYYLNLVNGY